MTIALPDSTLLSPPTLRPLSRMGPAKKSKRYEKELESSDGDTGSGSEQGFDSDQNSDYESRSDIEENNIEGNGSDLHGDSDESDFQDISDEEDEMLMEDITNSVGNLQINSEAPSHKKNQIQVSNTKRPIFFYVSLAKRYMHYHDEIQLSGLGMAIATVVTVAEILKNSGFVVEKKITTSTISLKDESGGRPHQKAKIEILLGKSDKFDQLVASSAQEREETFGQEN